MWASYGFGFGRNLRQLRLARGLSQQALAIAGSATAVADPAMSTVYKLALALNIPPALLLPGASDALAAEGEGGAEPAVTQLRDIAPFPASYVAQRRKEADLLNRMV